MRAMDEAVNDDALDISLGNDLREIAGVAAKIDEFCAAQALAPQIAYAVNLAIDEVLTNTISYGYDDEDPHRIELIVDLESDRLVVVIVDDSRAFDPSLVREADVEAPLEERALGGLGLFLVQQMMDGVEYQRRAGCNVVTLTKNTADEGSGGASISADEVIIEESSE